jgi:hypothetical protein
MSGVTNVLFYRPNTCWWWYAQSLLLNCNATVVRPWEFCLGSFWPCLFAAGSCYNRNWKEIRNSHVNVVCVWGAVNDGVEGILSNAGEGVNTITMASLAGRAWHPELHGKNTNRVAQLLIGCVVLACGLNFFTSSCVCNMYKWWEPQIFDFLLAQKILGGQFSSLLKDLPRISFINGIVQ